LELSDPSRAALDAGIKDILRDLVESTARQMTVLMAQAHGNRLPAFNQGLRDLRSRLPQYEEKLIALHLDLGVLDAVAIGERVAKEFRQVVPAIAKGRALALHGADRPGANRAAKHFEAEVGMYTSGVTGRVLVAVERHRRRNPGMMSVMSGKAVPSDQHIAAASTQGEHRETLDAVREEWDLFVSHASEDKAAFVTPLVRGLESRGLRVWFDDHTLKLGDSLSAEIDRGLAKSRFGIVVLSHAFFEKRWPQRELAGLVQREMSGGNVILPIWHGVTCDDVKAFSVTLADKRAVQSVDGMSAVVREILKAVGRPTVPDTSDNDTTGGAVRAEKFGHRLRANFQGMCSLTKGKSIEIHRFIGPNRPTGSGTLRILRMVDLDGEITYTSAVYNLMMTIQPTNAIFRARVAGAINQTPDSLDFDIEMTDEEYAKFAPHAEPQLSPLVK
jgi:hypothetical protein